MLVPKLELGNQIIENFVLSAIAPALLYLLHPCSRSCLRGYLLKSAQETIHKPNTDSIAISENWYQQPYPTTCRFPAPEYAPWSSYRDRNFVWPVEYRYPENHPRFEMCFPE